MNVYRLLDRLGRVVGQSNAPIVARGDRYVTGEGRGHVWLDPRPRDGSTVTVTDEAPPTPVPAEVTKAQFVLALDEAGITDQAVDAIMTGVANPAQRRAAVLRWKYTATVRRDSNLIAALAEARNLTTEQVDNLFHHAATL